MDRWHFCADLEEETEEEVGSCPKGHGPSFSVQREDGGEICLSCLCGMISDRSALLVDRGYTITEFQMALKDAHFASALITFHDTLLVSPLCDAMVSSGDAIFTKSVMDSVFTLCKLAEHHGKSLVKDFIIEIARQISAPSTWNRTEYRTLHLMGLLLEMYSKESIYLPDAIKTHRKFLLNLISLLGDPGAEIQGGAIFVLLKVASFQEGAEALVRCCPKACEEVIDTLLRCDSDELRINSLALLTILGERGLLTSGFVSAPPEDERMEFSAIHGSQASQTSPRARSFIQALKGCFLSSDWQVQASSLGLMSMVYSGETRSHEQIQLLAEEGLVNYVLETLRISEEQETVQSSAVDLLALFSCERHLYMQRFPLVLQTLVPILDKSVGSLSFKLQKDILDLICTGIVDQPATLYLAHSERLLIILSGLLEQYKSLMEDGGTSRLHGAYFSACSTLIALLQAPNFSLTCNTFKMLRYTTGYAAEFAASEVQKNSLAGSACLNSSFCLLRAAYDCNDRHMKQSEWPLENQEELIHICDEYLSPVFAENPRKVEDGDLVSTAYKTFTLILKTSHPERSCQFAQRLALYKYFSFSYALLARFSSFALKEEIYHFLASLIEKLVGSSLEEKVVNAFPKLPSNPASLLLLLERNVGVEKQLLAAQHAALSILSVSALYDDRVCSEIEVIASLEQHLLLNKDSTLAETVASDLTLKHFLSLFVRGKTVLAMGNILSSSEAERILVKIVMESRDRRLLCWETPKEIFRWFLQKDLLTNFTLSQLRIWFTSDEHLRAENVEQAVGLPPGGKRGYEQLTTFAEILVEDPCFTEVPLSLFHWVYHEGTYDEIRAVLRLILTLARMVPGLGLELLYASFEESLQLLLQNRPNMGEVTELRTLCLELLFHMLLQLQSIPGGILRSSWLGVANLCLLRIQDKVKASATLDEGVLPHISVVNMILLKSSEEDGPVEAANLLACNKDLCSVVEQHIVMASSHSDILSKTCFGSSEGQILCSAMVFHLLRLRWALKNKNTMPDQPTAYFGFASSEWPTTEDRCETYATSVTSYATSITCKELCRILYYGAPTFKLLASMCILEAFSQLDLSDSSDSVNPVKILELPNQLRASVTMCLQGCVLEDSLLVRRYASWCLYLLMHSPALSPQQRRITASSAWNRMFVEHVLASLSSMHSEGPTCTCGRALCYAAYITLGVLRINPPLEWLPSVFSQKIISDVVARLSEDKISPVIICIFHELLRLNYLTNDHLIKLRNIFQAIRKSIYDRRRMSNVTETDEMAHIRNESIRHSETGEMLPSVLFGLLVQSGPKITGNVCPEFDLKMFCSGTGDASYVSLLDKFFQDNGRFSN
ncbi:hypothetical protein R1sor_012731 [Riccia sorocarpa]|uniref:Uncharacterized protein n=1 Tax=Riccia sorocarpa TaxID=122646 RepID=A0ABD3I4L7_9MARC